MPKICVSVEDSLSAWLEWSGSLIGLIGAGLLASHCSFSEYGWIAFLAANFLVLGLSIRIKRYGLMVQQMGFLVTSILGIVRSLA